MKPLLLTIVLLFSTPSWASQAISYSVLYEEDGEQILIVSDHEDGNTYGTMHSYGGNKWFKGVFKKDAKVLVYLSPKTHTNDGDNKSYFQERYLIENFQYEFEEQENGDQFLYFLSREATNRIKNFIHRDKSFVISGINEKAWTASTFYPIKTIEDLLKLSNFSPTAFCNLISTPIVNNTQNRQIGTINLKLYMKNRGLECDNFNNIIIPKDKNKTSSEAKLLQENNDPFANTTKPKQPGKLDPFR